MYEEKEINIIQDIYSPCENLEYNKRQITTMKNRKNFQISKQINEKIILENLENKTILDVDMEPIVVKENRLKSKVLYECELEMRILVSDNNLDIETQNAKIPFDFVIDDLQNGEEINMDINMEIRDKNFVIQDGGNVTTNVDMVINANSYENANLNVIDELQSSGEREEQDYNIVMYIVKKGDSLWKIAKQFGSTIDDIARTNGIEDVDVIMPGQKLYIPRYTKKENKKIQMVSHV